jgi:hypothetical protein
MPSAGRKFNMAACENKKPVDRIDTLTAKMTLLPAIPLS